MNCVFEKFSMRTLFLSVKSFLKNFKYAWQRITKGYCERDVHNIDSWFLSVIPNMLKELKITHHGFPSVLEKERVESCYAMTYEDYIKNASQEQKEEILEYCDEQWGEILEEMIFLFREACVETCSKGNPYELEYHNSCTEFEKKYGIFGEKLSKDKIKQTGTTRICTPDALPEYKEICNLYNDTNREIKKYREACEKQAFELLTKWFHSLWD